MARAHPPTVDSERAPAPVSRERLGRVVAPRGRGHLWPLLALALAFALTVGVVGAGTRGGPVLLELDLTFSSNACCQLTVWLNDVSDGQPEAVLPIQAGRRWIYGLPVLVRRLSTLRFDPGTAKRSSVVLHGLVVRRGDEVLARLGRAELLRFAAARAVAKERADGLVFRSSGPEPAIGWTLSIDTGASRAQTFLTRLRAEPLQYVVGLVLLGVLLTIPLALPGRRQALLLASLGGVIVAVYLLPRLLVPFRIADEVDRAVGLAAYTGVPKSREQLLVQLAAGFAVVIPALVVVAARLAFRGQRWQGGGKSSELARESPPARALLLPAAVVVLLALVSVPDLRAELAAARERVYLPGFDGGNLLFWEYLVQQGAVPVKDFFYPYGLQHLFTLDAPWGSVIGYLNYTAFWAYLIFGTFVALSRVFAGRALVQRFAFVTALVLVFVLAGHLAVGVRYVGAIGVVLLFAGAGRNDGLLSSRRLLFMLAFAHLALFEGAQAIYAFAAVLVLAAIELAPLVRGHAREAGSLALRYGAALGLPWAVAAVVLALTGQLRGTVEFYSQLGALTSAWAAPSRVHLWIVRPGDLEGFVFWAIPLTLALGTHRVLTTREPLRTAHGMVVALGVLGFMMLQKQVLRPAIETAIWLPALFGLLFWAAIEAPLDRLRHWAALAALVGIVAGVAHASGRLERGLEQLAGGPGRAAGGVSTIVTEREDFAMVAETRFARSRFRSFGDHPELVAALREDASVRAGAPVWVLGDDSAITMLLGQRWPYYFNSFYDTSPIAWQRKLLRRLAHTPPALVAWNREALAFDGVPHVVRVPLVFQWAVASLVPHRTVGQFEILRPKARGEPIDLAWWRGRLGAIVDLGHVPELVHAGGDPCSSAAKCGTYVLIELPDRAAIPLRAEIRLTVGSLPFRVGFATAPGTFSYAIRVDRLWFWLPDMTMMPRAIPSPELAGARISIVRRERAPDVLY